MRYVVHTELNTITQCSSVSSNFFCLQIPKEEVDLPNLRPNVDYTNAVEYPPKLVLTVSTSAAEVGLPYSSNCQISVIGFIEDVQFSLRLRPSSPHGQLNHHSLLPSKTDSETEQLSFGRLTYYSVK